MKPQSKDLFSRVTEMPDLTVKRIYEGLVGLDSQKERLQKEGSMILNPASLDAWSKAHYGESIPLTRVFKGRSPLFVFAGDVGTGKTALARSFGDRVARESGKTLYLYSLSLSTRGTGAVGEMTALISAAFAEIMSAALNARSQSGSANVGIVFLIDEADAIAQSRAMAQMHHEDRAGVNALIRGIDEMAESETPVLIVMCTNRLDAIDPAVLRRAAGIFEFQRPTEMLREKVLATGLAGVGFAQSEIAALAKATGAIGTRRYGLTYSDLTNRLLPDILMDAFPNKKISFDSALQIASELIPTPPFGASAASEEVKSCRPK